MVEIIHIHEKEDKNKIKEVEKRIASGKDVYILIYMVGCGPCNHVRPEWDKLEAKLSKEENLDNSVVVDMNQAFLQEASKFISPESIQGFPTIRLINKSGSKNFNTPLPKASQLVEWITKKLKGGATRRRTRKTRTRTRRTRTRTRTRKTNKIRR